MLNRGLGMTPNEVRYLQIKLTKQGFPVAVDGIYGPKTRDAYAAYLDQDTNVPTVVPPAAKPWWQSKTAIFTLATILVSIAALAGFDVDKSQLTEVITSALTLVTGLLALWSNARRRAPIDSSLIAPGVRIAAPTRPVPPKSETNQREDLFTH